MTEPGGQDLASRPDGPLISAYLDGDNAAFDVLYARYRKPLYGYLSRHILGSPALVDDLHQQTWVRVLGALPRYRDRSRFLPWLLQIAHNLVVDHFRRARPECTVDIEQVALPGRTEEPWRALDEAALRERVDAAIAELKPDLREVVLLRLTGLSFRQIARIQGTGLNTALGRMHHAVKRLRARLHGAARTGGGK